MSLTTRKSLKQLLLASSVAGLLFTSPSVATAGGTIVGAVRFQGTIPPADVRPVTIDAAHCGKKSVSESLVVGKKGGVKNAVVSIRGPVIGSKPYPKRSGGFTIDQRGCRFEPHVLIMAPGPLEVLNTDAILHSFHATSRANPPVNKAQSRSMPRMKLTFSEPETFSVRCDLHDWMQAWIVVAPHAYFALTDEAGHFQLTDVPSGDYTLELWHERLGNASRRVQVSEGGETPVDWVLTLPRSGKD